MTTLQLAKFFNFTTSFTMKDLKEAISNATIFLNDGTGEHIVLLNNEEKKELLEKHSEVGVKIL
jgi:hypothetical protein